MPNRLQQLHDADVSLWLDFIERTMLHNGDLERRIREDALTGMTSNPTIFAKALAEGTAHDRVIGAYMSGLEDRMKRGQPVDRIASVASFFVSRVDTEVDKRLDAIDKNANATVRGKAAIANAKLAYQLFLERFSSPRWKA